MTEDNQNHTGNHPVIRKLTEKECLRLMDFDDEEIARIQTAKDERGKPLFSKSYQYKMAGNSIVVQCLTEVFEVILDDMDRAPKPRGLDRWMVDE